MAEPRKADPPEDWPQRFLSEYSKTGNIAHSARKARVTRQGVYDRRAADAEFASAMEEAREHANALLELEALRRAVRGTLRPVFHKGEQCGAVREFSDTLLIVLMKANMPEKYKERGQVEHTGRDGGPIEHEHRLMDFGDCDDSELKERLARASGELAAGGLPPQS